MSGGLWEGTELPIYEWGDCHSASFPAPIRAGCKSAATDDEASGAHMHGPNGMDFLKKMSGIERQ